MNHARPEDLQLLSAIGIAGCKMITYMHVHKVTRMVASEQPSIFLSPDVPGDHPSILRIKT